MKITDLLADRISAPHLSREFVQVWSFSTEASPPVLAALDKLLSSEERERAARFHFDRDRHAFMVCRGLLRALLAFYLSAKPGELKFRFGPQGKPFLAQPPGPELQFSVSHSGERGVLAFALDRETGVDIEFMRDNVDFPGLAERSFSESECTAVVALPAAQQAPRFYEYWSCKEACIKADGRGLSCSLSGFSIVPSSGRPQWRDVQVTEPQSVSAAMRIRILDSPANYASAVAAPESDWDILPFSLDV